jgi:hypothetical protein
VRALTFLEVDMSKYWQQFENWLSGIYEQFITYLYSLLLSLFDMLKDFFFWLLEQLWNLVIFLLHALDALVGQIATFDFVSYITLIPEPARNIMALLGISTALTIRGTSLLIRFLLQCIPFVRWGS